MNTFTRPNGYAVELRNCLAEAREDLASRNAEAHNRIGAAIAAGKTVVVCRSTYYCRATDGIAGEAVSLEHIADTHEAAVAWLNDQYDAGKLDEEASYDVLPRPAAVVPPAEVSPAANTDEVPF